MRLALQVVAAVALPCLVSPAARAQSAVAEVRPGRAFIGQEVRYYVQAKNTRLAP